MERRLVFRRFGHGALRKGYVVETFSAVPSFLRLAITVLDKEHFEESTGDDIPTITKIFIGYVKGPGTPVPVMIDISQLDVEYTNEFPTPVERETLRTEEWLYKARRANLLRRRDLLLAVIPGLDPEDANILAADGIGGEPSVGERILTKLGWISAISDEEEEVVDEEGEVKEVDETGES